MKYNIKIPKIFKFKKYKDKRGYLIPFEFNKKKNNFPFEIKRVFFSFGKKNYFRGDHAHKKCSQLLLCLNGKIIIKTLDLKNRKKTFIISKKKNTGIIIPPLIWNKIYFKDKNSLLGVLCNYKYDRKNEYINDFKFFKNLITN